MIDIAKLVGDLQSGEPERVAAAGKILKEIDERSAGIQADLDSEDPQRITAALKTLNHGTTALGLVAVTMPPPDVLGAFGDNVPLEVVRNYVAVIGGYSLFRPKPDPTTRREAMVVALIFFAHSDRQVAYDIALTAQIDSPTAAPEVLSFASHQDPENPDVQRAVLALMDNFLDAATTREIAVTELWRWVQYGQFPEILDAMRPRLEPSERARLVVED